MLVDIKNIRAQLVIEGAEIKLVELKDSPHYKYLCGDKQSYIDYLIFTHQPEHSIEKYNNLISNFDIKKAIPIQCDFIENKYVISNGFHRACIMLKLGYTEIEIKLENRQKLICDELIKTTNYAMYNNWTNSILKHGYHSFNIEEINIIGQRNIRHRINEIRKHYDFKGKNILDLGCNVGGMLFHIQDINKAVGVDYDPIVIRAAENISKILNVKNIDFIQFDFNTDDYKLLKNEIRISPDIIFLLAMGSWVEKWMELYAFALSYNCPIILETNNDKAGPAQLIYFEEKKCNIKLIINGSPDDVTGNNLRKTYLVTHCNV